MLFTFIAFFHPLSMVDTRHNKCINRDESETSLVDWVVDIHQRRDHFLLVPEILAERQLLVLPLQQALL